MLKDTHFIIFKSIAYVIGAFERVALLKLSWTM
jgi:hypothetical protein